MTNYAEIYKRMKNEKLVDICNELGLNYDSTKNGIYRYRTKINAAKLGNQKSSKVINKSSKNSKLTVSKLIEIAKQEQKKDPANKEFNTFIRRFGPKGKDQYLLRTLLKLLEIEKNE